MAHNGLRGTALHFGDYAGSRTHMVQALQICQTLGKRQGELLSLFRLAQTNFFLYDFAAAEAGFAAALERRPEMIDALQNLALGLSRIGRHAAAEALEIPNGTAKSRMNRALAALRAALEADDRTELSGEERTA
jgi:tetratricopeptide (TPR) repeat protein